KKKSEQRKSLPLANLRDILAAPPRKNSAAAYESEDSASNSSASDGSSYSGRRQNHKKSSQSIDDQEDRIYFDPTAPSNEPVILSSESGDDVNDPYHLSKLLERIRDENNKNSTPVQTRGSLGRVQD